MGVEVGFEFYKLVNGKLEEANIIESWNNTMCNYLNTCGRCDATQTFVNMVNQFEEQDDFSNNAKPEDEYSARVLLNHPELDGYEDHSNEQINGGWFIKYFFLELNAFKNCFEFEEAQEKHDGLLKELNDELISLEKEIESLRIHQENAKTKVAFDCFEERITVLKENIACKREYIKDIEEDDYDYNHYMWIKKDIEKVEEIIKNDPDIIVAAYASD